MSKLFSLTTCFAGLLLLTVMSCTKTAITLQDKDTTSDPAIVYYDDYPVEIGTYKTDSFRTSGHSVFTVGHHTDPVFGNLHAASFATISLPTVNPVLTKDVRFDSLVLVLKPNGNYYGDTVQPLQVRVYSLAEQIRNEDESNTNFYSPRNFAVNSPALAATSVTIRPGRDSIIRIKLPDAMGAELLQKFKSNAAEIRDETAFRNYLKGICVDADPATTQSLFYFTAPGGVLLRLHYTLNGTTAAAQRLDFYYNSTLQTNQLKCDYSSSAFNAFTPYKKQLRLSALTGHKAYLNSNGGSYIKVRFPELLQLKERFPYISLLKAELVVRPTAGTYNYPYQLPAALNISTTDDSNLPVQKLSDAAGQYIQTGNLTTNPLYSNNAYYSYDITAFLKTLMNQGSFSQLALLIIPPDTYSDVSMHRLVVNDQEAGSGIQLKLWVLGI